MYQITAWIFYGVSQGLGVLMWHFGGTFHPFHSFSSGQKISCWPAISPWKRSKWIYSKREGAVKEHKEWALYLSPLPMSAGPVARAAGGRGHRNNPCFSALKKRRNKRRARESSNEYTLAKRIITFTPFCVYWWSLPMLQTKRKQHLIRAELESSVGLCEIFISYT